MPCTIIGSTCTIPNTSGIAAGGTTVSKSASTSKTTCLAQTSWSLNFQLLSETPFRPATSEQPLATFSGTKSSATSGTRNIVGMTTQIGLLPKHSMRSASQVRESAMRSPFWVQWAKLADDNTIV